MIHTSFQIISVVDFVPKIGVGKALVALIYRFALRGK